MLLDFILISALIVVAQLMRYCIPLLGKMFIPTPMLAGVLGIIGGPQVLKILPFSMVEKNGEQVIRMSDYAGILITFLFATLMMGYRTYSGNIVRRLKRVRGMLCYSIGAELGQFGIAALLGATLFAVMFPELHKFFAVMMPSGFVGGYGTAAVFGDGFKTYWPEALTIGFAFATFGMAVSTFGGMMLTNLAVAKGWAKIERTAEEASDTTFLAPSQQFFIGTATSNPSALDPLAWHFVLVTVVYGITVALISFIPKNSSVYVPQFAIAMLVGAAVQVLLNQIKVGHYVDQTTIKHIGSTSADLLVAFGVASVKLSVIGKFIVPILLLSIVGTVYSLAVFFLGAWVFRRYWFERSVFTFGWVTGVVGVSVALLRLVDPRLKSGTIEEYGTAYLLIGPFEIVLYSTMIWASTQSYLLATGVISMFLAVVMFFLARFFYDDAYKVTETDQSESLAVS